MDDASVEVAGERQAPSVIFDHTDQTPTQSLISGSIAVVGETLICSLTYAEMADPDAYVFSDEGWLLPRYLVICQSADGGPTWSQSAKVEIRQIAERVGVVSCPFVLADGELCVPVEIRTPGGPQGQAAIFSTDHGRTFSPRQDLAIDATAKHWIVERFRRCQSGKVKPSVDASAMRVITENPTWASAPERGLQASEKFFTVV